MTELSARGRQILTHALGLDRSSYPYRNHYVLSATPTQEDRQMLDDLAAAGLMRREVKLEDGAVVYRVTVRGARAVGVAGIPDGEAIVSVKDRPGFEKIRGPFDLQVFPECKQGEMLEKLRGSIRRSFARTLNEAQENVLVVFDFELAPDSDPSAEP